MLAMNSRKTLVTLSLILTAFSFQNCGQFKILELERAEVLNRSVLGHDNLYSNMSSVTAETVCTEWPCPTPSPSPSPSPTATPTPTATPSPTPGPSPTPEATPTPTPSPVDPLILPIKRHCDGDKGYWWAYNKVSALQGNNGVFARITGASGAVFCEVQNIVEELKVGKLTLPTQCLGGLTKEAFLDQLAYADRSKPIKFQIFALKGTTEWQINDPKKKKSNGAVMQELDPSWVYMGRHVDGQYCDQNLSPLFIDLRSNVEYDKKSPLSSPAHGVRFDLLGDFAAPPFAPRQKVQVSWFRHPKLMFLALPNHAGMVDGINELFGNHTSGPDRLGADDGFAALAKYDGYVPPGDALSTYSRKADGVINSRDWVFSRLRLWSDRNVNGISESSELYPLMAVGIVSIELNYDQNYREMDKYKNEIRYKSIVNMKNKTKNLIFDAWLALPKN